MPRLAYEPAKCSGCGSCELACSLTRHGVAAPDLARIRLRQDYRRMEHRVTACRHCAEPECVALCPAGAISRTASGLVAVDKEACTGCRACLECACGGMAFDALAGHAVTCDLCGGQPACVDLCPKQALTLQGGEE